MEENKTPKKEEKQEEAIEEGTPICEECGNAMIQEDGEWVCPNCDGQIDYMGDDEDDEDLAA
jgi:rubrerythrin